MRLTGDDSLPSMIKVHEKPASGGKDGEATLGKNTLKAGCECSHPSFLRVFTFADSVASGQRFHGFACEPKPVYQTFM